MQYLTRENVIEAYNILRTQHERLGEPIPPLYANRYAEIDQIIAAPQAYYFGIERYPTLAEKAAVILYEIAKSYPFENGNKRMSIYCASIFLYINGVSFREKPDEDTNKVLAVAQSQSQDREIILKDLSEWFDKRIKSNSEQKI